MILAEDAACGGNVEQERSIRIQAPVLWTYPIIQDLLFSFSEILPLGDGILGLYRRLCESAGGILTSEDYLRKQLANFQQTDIDG